MSGALFDPYELEHVVSAKGVPVYVKNLPWITGWFTVRILIRVGAVDDPEGKAGLAHFLEHLPFNGTALFPSSEAIDDLKRNMFNDSLNAWTGPERTMFGGTLLSDDADEGMRVFRDLIFSPLLNAEEIERERNVVIQEVRRGIPNRMAETVKKTRQEDLYFDHPFSRFARAFGWEESVKAITRDDLVAFHAAHYQTGNISLFFVGDVKNENAVRLADRVVDGVIWRKSVRNPQISLASTRNGPRVPSRVYSMKEEMRADEEVSRSAGIEVWRVIPHQENVQAVALLGGMVHDKLMERMRRARGIVYSAAVRREMFSDHMRFSIETSVDPAAYQEALGMIEAVLAEVCKGDIETKFFEEERKSRANFLRARDYTVSDIAGGAVDDVVKFGRVRSVARELADVEAVKLENVIELVREELSPAKLYWLTIRP